MKQLFAYAVATLGVAAGGLMNAWLGYSKGGEAGEAWSLLGLTIIVGPSLLLAGLFAVCDIVKVTLPGRIAWHLKQGEVREAWRWRIIFYALCGLSFTSALGFGLTLNENLHGSHAAGTEKLALLKAEQRDLERRLSTLKGQPGFDRQLNAIEARLAAMRVERRWKTTGGCDPRQTTAQGSISFCKRYRETEGEARLAGEAQRLRLRLTEVRRQASWASSTTVMRAADPQATLLAQLPWLDQRMAGALIMLLLAWVSELTLANIWHWAEGFGRQAELRSDFAQQSNAQTCQSQIPNVQPRLVVDNTMLAINKSSHVDAFAHVLFESFQFNVEGQMRASKAYEHFVATCENQGLKPKCNYWFSAQLLSHEGIKRITRNGRRFYVGLAPNDVSVDMAA